MTECDTQEGHAGASCQGCLLGYGHACVCFMGTFTVHGAMDTLSARGCVQDGKFTEE